MGKAGPSPNIIDIKTVFLTTDNAPQLWVGLLEAEELLGHQLGGGWLHEDRGRDTAALGRSSCSPSVNRQAEGSYK